jgi:transcriptional regulator with XRE-family HTH domain
LDKKTFKLIRLFHGYSQEEYAELLGVNQSSVAKAELGRVPITDRMRAKVARHFDAMEPEFLQFKQRMSVKDEELPN